MTEQWVCELSIIRLENLPNELLFHLCSYFEIRQLYRSFHGLNIRWNAVLHSLDKAYLVLVKKDDLSNESDAPSSLITHVSIHRAYPNLSFDSFHNSVYSMSIDSVCEEQIPQLNQLNRLKHLKIKCFTTCGFLEINP